MATGSFITARDGHTATLLVDGTVLIAGGTNSHSRLPPWGMLAGDHRAFVG